MSQPFLMTIVEIKSQNARDKFCSITGIVQSGAILKGSRVEIVSLQNQRILTQITDVETSSASEAGSIKVTLQNDIDVTEFMSGFIISPPQAIECHNAFLADITLLPPEKGGRATPICFVIGYTHAPSYEVIVNIYGLTFLRTPIHPNAKTISYMELQPGETATLLFQMWVYLPLMVGLQFHLQQGRQMVAYGVVTELL